MIFSNKNIPDVPLNINHTVIERVHVTKILGFLVDDNLIWTPHINYIKGKLSKCISILKKG